jgi:hypothetical protein
VGRLNPKPPNPQLGTLLGKWDIVMVNSGNDEMTFICQILDYQKDKGKPQILNPKPKP